MTTRRGDDWLIPTTDEEMARCLADPEWRLFSGYLYKIIIKGDKDEEGLVMPFRPNRAQRRFIRRLWHRNIILKARQLGFSTLICILWLDTALFCENVRCGIIAQDREAAESLFRDKVKFAYDQLPDALRRMMPLKANNASTLVFGHNNSSIRVATSMRSGTIHRLHISEFGKICAKYPDKAVEVITGSIPAVPSTGVLVIESTAEGRDGAFYKITQAAMAAAESGKKLSVKDYRFHFFPWWQEPGYQIDPDDVLLTEQDEEYFAKVEGITGAKLTSRQKAWYVATRDGEFSGEDEKMWQEYPSCIAGDELISTCDGLIPIRDVSPDGNAITHHYAKGVKPIFEIRTRLGYSVKCTDDHPVKLKDGSFSRLADGLRIGNSVAIGRPGLSSKTQIIDWSPVPFVSGRIEITPDFAEFLGVFMGDGSFYDGSVSIACDAQDSDMIAVVEQMFDRYLGGGHVRATGKNKGCIEVRKSSVSFAEPMLALGLVERRNSGGLKRRVHIPDYIFRSPERVVRAFLRGLFEADGFAARDGASIKFFSKHRHVVSGVQLLLLALGIESRASKNDKSSGEYTYTGWELALRADGVRKFAKEVGFISSRKQERANISLTKRKTSPSHSFDWSDEIVSVEPAGFSDVYDITTATHEFVAGGIVVHNCAEEAFQVSTEGCYFTKQLTAARKEGRIKASVPLLPNVPCNTYWDIGNSDGTAIWVVQRLGGENRLVRFYEAWGEPYSHAAQWLQSLGAVFGTHHLPHDADHVRQGQNRNISPRQMLEELMPGQRFATVDRIQDVNWGIQQTRDIFPTLVIDETHCKAGLAHISAYRKKWNDRLGCWSDEPDKTGGHSEAADALRQLGQTAHSDAKQDAGKNFMQKRRSSANWRRT